ncbi:hypothetical protein HPB48_017105 [Haemaphysalis longicornis]|uniref:Uncharacterized protein n=1 Tax=Haemaphysalis longicornis TaxID=44386 RepID=A0A9J6GJ34_HAELO|nr:hypothetical protein HPB48_017105 [Haemaphysalis longicornis]
MEEWVQYLQEHIMTATRTVLEEANLDKVNCLLLHMREAKSCSLQKRLHGQRHNRFLRRRTARLSKEIEKYVAYLTNQHWDALCGRMDVQMNAPKTWHTIRRLLNPGGRTQPNNLLTILGAHQEEGFTFLQKLKELYIQEAPRELAGNPNPEMDRPCCDGFKV